MSIFSRLRKRDADEPVAPSPGSGAKDSSGSSPQAKLAGAAAEPKASPPRGEAKPAPSQEHPNAARKAAPGGTTRVYEAAKPGAAPVARHAVPMSTESASRPPASSAAALPSAGAAD